MTRISLVVSDVDGTLLDKDKTLTDDARAAVRKLHTGGHRLHRRLQPSDHRHGLSDRAAGDHAADRRLQRQLHRRFATQADRTASDRPAVAQRSLDVLDAFGVDIWLFTNERWYIRNVDGEYVLNEQRAIKADPTMVAEFAPYLPAACKIVGASSDAALLQRCEAAMKQTLGEATAVRSQTYYLDVTPPGCDKGTFVACDREAPGHSDRRGRHHRRHGKRSADVPRSGISFAMGNATDDIKRRRRM